VTSGPTDHQDVWRIGRFRVEAVIGTGAFATVYRAVDDRLDDVVAVKVLADNHSLDPEIRKRFLTEGRVLRRIASPHVVAVYDLGETERQQPFLVLEYADRGTLAQRIRDLRAGGRRPGPEDLWAVAEPLAQGLDGLHAAGIVHRDVNPANLLLITRGVGGEAGWGAVVRGDERLVLADLGLCKDLALHSGHTSGGGTEGFRAPELRGGPAIIDHRADLWSLSAVLAWLATGSPPDVNPLGTRMPPALDEVLARGLADDPSVRHPDALSWLAEVRAALGQLEPRAEPSPGPPRPGRPIAQRSWSWRLRESAWVVTSLAAGLLTWAGFAYVGLVAKRRQWLVTSVVYGILAVVWLVLVVATPVDAQGNYIEGTWQDQVAVGLLLTLWVGGIVHSLVVNFTWLKLRAARADPVVTR
jgi:serine/threonine protein kinase